MARVALRVPLLGSPRRGALAGVPGSGSITELGHLLRDARRFLHERFERHGRVFKTRLFYPVVFVVGADNHVTFHPVKVGIAGDKYFEVVDGLHERDRIVGGTYQAIRELKDGALVHEPKPDKKKPDQKPVTQTAQAKP